MGFLDSMGAWWKGAPGDICEDPGFRTATTQLERDFRDEGPPPDGLELSVADANPRRGDDVRVAIIAASAGAAGAGALSVALLCRQHRVSSWQPGHGRFTKLTLWEHSIDVTADSPPELLFTIPPDAPFTYDGDHIAFGWMVRATERRHQSRQQTVRLEVRP